jgi:uncharacterized protein
MIRKLAAVCVAAWLLPQGATAFAAAEFKIVTAGERGTYIQIGRNLAQFVAPAADIDLEALPSAGSAENVKRLRFESGVKFALVQSDVYQAFLDQAALGNKDAIDMIRPLRVILPLYNEEIYFVVRADSELGSIHEIRNARINAGELGSGTALTTTTLYGLMFRSTIPAGNASFLSNEDALVKLITDKSVDVVAIIGGQPTKLLADMKPEARNVIKLLRFDPNQPESKAALKTYVAATVRATSYPNLLTEDLPALAVKAFLVTYDFTLKSTQDSLQKFGRSLCQNFAVLQEKGHPKWREVELALPDLGRGWSYYPATSSEIRACIAARAKPKPPPAKACSQQEQVLGLCK